MSLAFAENPQAQPAARRPGVVDIDADRMLVERAQTGDTAAFDELYRQYFPRLRAFCLRRVGDVHDAEELAQEAFAKAFAALPGFGGERRFYPWVTVIAGRLCIDHHRRAGRTEPVAQLEEDAVEGGQERVLVEMDAAVVRLALERLPERHRTVLRLREQEGWSYNRIAETQGLTIGAVESLLVRARRRLRDEFVTLSGGERALGAIPVLGAAWRRVQAAARRVAGAGIPGDALGLAAHAVTAAAVAAALVVPGAVASAGGGAVPTPGSSIAHVVGTATPAADASPPPARGLARPEHLGGSVGASKRPEGGHSRLAGDVGPHRGRTWSAADDHVEEKIVEVPGTAWVGASPGEIQRDLSEVRGDVVTWIEEKGNDLCVDC